METKHGWATTRTGSMLHYFGYDSRADGSPRALCHNALVVAPTAELLALPPADTECCDSCSRYLKLRRQEVRQAPAQAGGKLGPGSSVTITRGKMAGITTDVIEGSKDFPGVWWVKCGAGKPMMLSEGQLKMK